MVQEALGNLSLSAKYYKNVLSEDSTHVEAIACIGMNHFYSDQPELSLRYYRRLLQVFNHLLYCLSMKYEPLNQGLSSPPL